MRYLVKFFFLIFISSAVNAADVITANVAEKDVNNIFRRALMGAAAQLDKAAQVNPFAVVVKTDGNIGIFELPQDSKKNKDLTVDERVAHIRSLLQGAAGTQSIRGYCQVMYIVVNQDGIDSHGLSFEIEHEVGVSMQRFVPVEVNEDTGKIHLIIEKIITNNKPKVVFAEK